MAARRARHRSAAWSCGPPPSGRAAPAALQRWLLRTGLPRGRRSGRRPDRRSRSACPPGHVVPDGLAGEIADRARRCRPRPVPADPLLHRGDAADLLGRAGAGAGGGPQHRRAAVPGQLRHGPQHLRAARPHLPRHGAGRRAPRSPAATTPAARCRCSPRSSAPPPASTCSPSPAASARPRCARRCSTAGVQLLHGRLQPHDLPVDGGRGAAARRGPGPARLTVPSTSAFGAESCGAGPGFRYRKLDSGFTPISGRDPPRGANAWELSLARPILAGWRAPELHFLGHSTVRVELAGRTVLTDPVLAPAVGLAAPRRAAARPGRLGRRRPRADQPPARRPPAPALAAHARPAHPRSSSRAAPAPGCAAAASRTSASSSAGETSRTATCASPASAPSTAATAGGPRLDPRPEHRVARPPARGRRLDRLRQRRHRPLRRHAAARRAGRRRRPAARLGLGPDARPGPPRPGRGGRGRRADPPAVRRPGALGHAHPRRHDRAALAAARAGCAGCWSTRRGAFATEVAARGLGTRVVVTEPGHPVVLGPSRRRHEHGLCSPRCWDGETAVGYPLLFGLVLLGSIVPVVPDRRRGRARPPPSR